MFIGRPVFVYQNTSRFSDPHPGLVTGSYKEADTLVDVEIFYPRGHPQSHCVARDRVTYCPDLKAAVAALGKGASWICGPYDPMDPKPFVEEAPAEVKAPKGKDPK